MDTFGANKATWRATWEAYTFSDGFNQKNDDNDL